MTRNGDEPDPGEYRALGRFTWMAISLEDRAEQVLQHFELPPSERIGRRLRQAAGRLDGVTAPEVREARQWLLDVQDAIKDRNAVLHGIPIRLFERGADGAIQPIGVRQIHHLPLSLKDQGRVIEVSEESFDALGDKLANLVARWQYVTIVLHSFVRGTAQRPGL